jgi:hypothetical protein
MPEYRTTAFKMELPDRSTDMSTYAFVVPGGGPEFNRTLVIKMDTVNPPVDLMDFMINQRSQLRSRADRFEIIAEYQARLGRFDAVTTIFEWNPNVQRIRQKQWYVHVPAQSIIWTLTATDLANRFRESEPVFDRIAESFVPEAEGVAPVRER